MDVMKTTIKNILNIKLLFIFILSISFGTIADAQRTLETQVADLLAEMPTQNGEYNQQLMSELVGIGKLGILQITDKLQPLGGNDTASRYAIESLARYTGNLDNQLKIEEIESVFQEAITNDSSIEHKVFLLRRMNYFASNYSVDFLSNLLNNDKVVQPAMAVLFSIGSDKSMASLLNHTTNSTENEKLQLVEYFGEKNYKPAQQFILNQAQSSSSTTKQAAFVALANMAPENASSIFLSQTNNKQLAPIVLNYGNQLAKLGYTKQASKIAKALLNTDNSALEYGAMNLALNSSKKAPAKQLLKWAKKGNEEQVNAAILLASQFSNSGSDLAWAKVFNGLSNSNKVTFLQQFSVMDSKAFISNYSNENEDVQIAIIDKLAVSNSAADLPFIMNLLTTNQSAGVLAAIQSTLLQRVGNNELSLISTALQPSTLKGKEVLVDILGQRQARSEFSSVADLIGTDKELDKVIFSNLPMLASGSSIVELTTLLNGTSIDSQVFQIQKTLNHIVSIDNKNKPVVLNAIKSVNDSDKWLPLVPELMGNDGLSLVKAEIAKQSETARDISILTLANWPTKDALPLLYHEVETNKKLGNDAFNAAIQLINSNAIASDQKLLALKEIMNFAKTDQNKRTIISSAGNVKTLLSFLFVTDFLVDENLKSVAASSGIRIALPSPGQNNGLVGELVNDKLQQCSDLLQGPDSQYVKIDVREYLEKTAGEKGFVSLFNGKDLTGWKGLVENPIKRRAMSPSELASKQKIADEEMQRDWKVEDGAFLFVGEGYKNICTVKDYGDIELYVDWKIGKGGDSGIYLRGTPQVQIWDTARVEVGAQVGSGGLYNNQKYESKPLRVADNPINEWNTFYIKMIAEKVTVYLNGELVVDEIPLENYWDRKLPIFTKDAIELQAHGENVFFKNVYVKELNSTFYELTSEEKAAGFVNLLNDEELSHWQGNKTDYVVEGGNLKVRPKNGGKGNLYTQKEYSDFNFRFEFKLTPGANNGLGIHTPLTGDAAYMGKELQILDNTASIYADLKDYQYHGSVYGIIPAKRGFLKPVGEWNEEEVIVRGNDIIIRLNGTEIINGNFKTASENGTLDGKNHPGLLRNTGHIGFLGHGSELEFRNIRIKDLTK